MTQVVNYKQLAEHLGCSTAVIRKTWKELPHFFVSRGRDLRSARFDLDEVLEHLKEQGTLQQYNDEAGS